MFSQQLGDSAPNHSETASSGAAAAAAAAPTPAIRTRPLKEVEEEENRKIYKELYESLDREDAAATESEDIVASAREAKAEFLRAASAPLKEKAKGCAVLAQQLGQPRNQHVLRVFVMVSAAMLILPLIGLMVGMKVVAPWLGVDDVLCGGFTAVGVVVAIGTGYVVYAFMEDAPRGSVEASEEERRVAQTKKRS